jgi:aminoglycoside phosphotransferase (APT) family kinase protein
MDSTDDFPQFEQIIQRIYPGSRLLRAWQLKGGLSAQMTGLEISRDGGQIQKMIVRRPGEGSLRRNPRAVPHEYRLLQILKTAGVAVPTPYMLDESGDIFPVPYLVMEYIDGSPEYAPADAAHFARQTAMQLAAIHRIDSAKLDLSFLPQSQRLSEKVAARPVNLDAPDEKRIRAALALAGSVSQYNPTVLLHGDFWAGNMLWREGQPVAVVDWEDASTGDPLLDFAISRLDMCLIFGREAMQAFTQQYQSMVDFDFGGLVYRDLYAALRAAPNLAAWSADYPELGRPDITAATFRAAHAWFVNRIFEKFPAG